MTSTNRVAHDDNKISLFIVLFLSEGTKTRAFGEYAGKVNSDLQPCFNFCSGQTNQNGNILIFKFISEAKVKPRD
jgi:hypothetical protein